MAISLEVMRELNKLAARILALETADTATRVAAVASNEFMAAYLAKINAKTPAQQTTMCAALKTAIAGL